MVGYSEDVNMSNYQMTLQARLHPKEAQSRGINEDTARLLLSQLVYDAKDLTRVYAKLIDQWRKAQGFESSYCIPIVPFASEDNIARITRQLELGHWLHKHWHMLRCRHFNDMEAVLEGIECEELAFFTANSDAAAETVLQFVSTYDGPEASHNAPFLRLNHCHWFAFFANSHSSLEILGKREYVIGSCSKLVFDVLFD